MRINVPSLCLSVLLDNIINRLMYVYTVQHHIAAFQFKQSMTSEKIRIGYQIMQKSFSDLRVSLVTSIGSFS